MFHKKKETRHHHEGTNEEVPPAGVCSFFRIRVCVCVCVCLGVQKREKDAACVDGCSAIKCVRRNGEIANNNNQPNWHTRTDLRKGPARFPFLWCLDFVLLLLLMLMFWRPQCSSGSLMWDLRLGSECVSVRSFTFWMLFFFSFVRPQLSSEGSWVLDTNTPLARAIRLKDGLGFLFLGAAAREQNK